MSAGIGVNACKINSYVGSARNLSFSDTLGTLTLNQRVQGSSPCAPTIEVFDFYRYIRYRPERGSFQQSAGDHMVSTATRFGGFGIQRITADARSHQRVARLAAIVGALTAIARVENDRPDLAGSFVVDVREMTQLCVEHVFLPRCMVSTIRCDCGRSTITELTG
jgi:hypothetical protein